MGTDRYEDPLVGRYTSKEMQHLFSEDFKFQTWRRCWTALAEAQMELGLQVVTPQMIDELVAAQKTIDYGVARAKEKEIRHDVMAHVYEYGTHCPTAKGIIHLGETSQFVGCNTDLIQMREATQLVKTGLVNVIANMAEIAEMYKGLTCLGYTHYQPAQPTTVGKRFTLYLQDLVMDLEALESLHFKARGTKGTTGTQASHLKLFDGNHKKVKALDQLVAAKLGFTDMFPVTGQTYPRKFDTKVAEAVAGIGVSCTRFADDLRRLSNLKCVDEPFEVDQTGSSAMPYKRNPMRSERISGLSRKLMGLVPNFQQTAAQQWFERTLDDSSIRRMDIPQLFLLADAVVTLAYNVTDQDVDLQKTRPLTFYPKRLKRLLDEELPFMATEAILMDLAKEGYDRQEMHQIIKKHSIDAGNAIKEEGSDNDLFRRLGNDAAFPLSQRELKRSVKDAIRFAGRAEQQTEEYLRHVVWPLLQKYDGIEGIAGEVRV